MRNPHGFLEQGRADGGFDAFDTVQCGHCGRHQAVKSKQAAADLGGFCRCCMTCLCGPCVATGFCEPYMKKIEASERRDRLMRSLSPG